ncbi:MAG: Imidazole glycerol phosphate synthase subunit HisH 1 [Syntrophorhabdus sp. PtaB.Bin006]|nr:MAG: Imidazole glycerol phosphate synthase subunit HisH 1 [Syntrophorhabdus sp. PtaB.Bin006]
MIAIVDYGMGNLRSVANAFEGLGANAVLTRDKDAIERADAIVLPGVGAFGKCIENLRKLDLFDLIKDLLNRDKLYLGICLGMQILFDSSEEAPGVAGMGFIGGRVPRFAGGVKIPHMGWNTVDIVKPHPIFEGVENGSYFYFVHSFYCEPEEDGVTATRTTYGTEFASSVQKGNVFACQFHPEKSQKIGLKLLSNFIRLSTRASDSKNAPTA